MHAAVFREKYGGLINNFLFVLQCSAAAAAQTLKWMIYGIEISREFACCCYVVKGKNKSNPTSYITHIGKAEEERIITLFQTIQTSRHVSPLNKRQTG